MDNHKLLPYFGVSLFMLLLSHWMFVEAAPTESLVTQLPGFNDNFLSKHYSGYVTPYNQSYTNLNQFNGSLYFIFLISDI